MLTLKVVVKLLYKTSGNGIFPMLLINSPFQNVSEISMKTWFVSQPLSKEVTKELREDEDGWSVQSDYSFHRK